MSKDVIDRIKQAEAKSLLELKEARDEAARLVKDAGTEASCYIAAEVKKARDEAAGRKALAEAAAETVIKKAEEDALKAEADMKKEAASRQEEAVKEVINSLL